jgi:hypothetical protein
MFAKHNEREMSSDGRVDEIYHHSVEEVNAQFGNKNGHQRLSEKDWNHSKNVNQMNRSHKSVEHI